MHKGKFHVIIRVRWKYHIRPNCQIAPAARANAALTGWRAKSVGAGFQQRSGFRMRGCITARNRPFRVQGVRGRSSFTGCNLKCVFCQNYQISQEYKPGDHKILTVDELALEMLRLQEMGRDNINFVSPSHMIFQMADAVSAAKKRGLTIPILYNSNGYDSVDALRQINRLVDIYLPDIKYLDNSMAQRYSGVGDYAEVIPGVLREMFAQVGHLEMDKNGDCHAGFARAPFGAAWLAGEQPEMLEVPG